MESIGQMATRNSHAADPRTSRLANSGEPIRSLIMGQTLYRSLSRIGPVTDSERPVPSWNFDHSIHRGPPGGARSMSGMEYKQLLQGRGIDATRQDNVGGIHEPQPCNSGG